MAASGVPRAVIDAVKAQLDEEEEEKRRAEALAAQALLRKQRDEAKLWFDLRPVFEAQDRWRANNEPGRSRFDVTTGVPLNTVSRHEALADASG